MRDEGRNKDFRIMLNAPDPEPERIIGYYRRSPFTPGFWWRVIFSLGLYLVLWPRNQITLTNRRIMQHRVTFWNSNEIWLNLENIVDVHIKTPALGSLLGFGDIVVQSFVNSRQADIEFRGLDGASRLRNAIFALQDHMKQRPS
jgi:hypothetical protein